MALKYLTLDGDVVKLNSLITYLWYSSSKIKKQIFITIQYMVPIMSRNEAGVFVVGAEQGRFINSCYSPVSNTVTFTACVFDSESESSLIYTRTYEGSSAHWKHLTTVICKTSGRTSRPELNDCETLKRYEMMVCCTFRIEFLSFRCWLALAMN